MRYVLLLRLGWFGLLSSIALMIRCWGLEVKIFITDNRLPPIVQVIECTRGPPIFLLMQVVVTFKACRQGHIVPECVGFQCKTLAGYEAVELKRNQKNCPIQLSPSAVTHQNYETILVRECNYQAVFIYGFNATWHL